ncbi:MAG: CBS domain-containing protein [Anaerolineae bacterium]
MNHSNFIVDELDRQIIALLQRDGRMTNVEIARELGIAEGTVRKRLERLLGNEVIHVTAVADPALLNLLAPVIVGIQAEPHRIQEVADRLAQLPEVNSVAIVTGAFDIVIEAVLLRREDLLSFLTDQVAHIPGVKRTETYQVLKAVKWARDWRLPEGFTMRETDLSAWRSGGTVPSWRRYPVNLPTDGRSAMVSGAMRTVHDILQRKGRDFWWVTPDTTVYEALRLMAEKDVGAVLVLEGEQLVGILSERDYARKVILHGKSSKETLVREIMTPKVLTVTPETLIEVCMGLMTTRRVRHLPVMEGGRVVGVVSIGDVVNAIIAEQQYVIEQLRAFHDYDLP